MTSMLSLIRSATNGVNQVAQPSGSVAASGPAPAPLPSPAIAPVPPPPAAAAPLPAPAAMEPAPGIIAAATAPAPAPALPSAPAAAPAPSGSPLVSPTVGLTASPGSGSVATLGQPKSWDVTSDQTVEGRINSIINGSSPIIQQARTRAAEQMNGRGLLNSSLALTAGEAAAYQAATPIATADAATAAKSASYNADEANQFGIKNQDAFNQKAIAQLNTETQKQITQLQNDNQKLLQSNNQAATAFNQAMVSITNVNTNDKMDAGAKTQAVAQIQRDLSSQLRVLSATSGLNLSAQLNFAGFDGFDSSGNYVGFDASGNTVGVAGSTPAAAAAPTGPAYTGYDNSGGGG